MATVKLNILVSDVRNRLGNVVFSKWKKTNYVREYAQYSRGNTPRQVEVRSAFSLLASVWKTMGIFMQSTWDHFSSGQNMTGRNAFIGANVKNVIDGAPLELFKPMGKMPVASFSAGAGSSPGAIRCLFALPAGSENSYVFFFSQLRNEGRGTNVIRRFDAGMNPASPFDLTGLNAGAEYFVYAVLADNGYLNASEASASTAVSATAGE